MTPATDNPKGKAAAMPRPERPLDPAAGPIQAFAAALRKLREEAGNPKYLQMARHSGKSRTALTEAAGGDHLATWETVAAFVTACRGDLMVWRVKWEAARDAARKSGQVEDNEIGQNLSSADLDAVTQANRSQPSPELGSGRPTPGRCWRVALLVTVPAVLGAVAGAGITALLLHQSQNQSTQNPAASSASNAAPAPVHSSAVITVQNKVALGPSQLIEDSTPAYLSTKAIPYCANTHNDCKVPGTELASGALLVAVCHVTGTEMFNYNLDSSESRQNPNRTASKLWYRAVFPDGRSGYISEVYVAPADREGKGLPTCT